MAENRCFSHISTGLGRFTHRGGHCCIAGIEKGANGALSLKPQRGLQFAAAFQRELNLEPTCQRLTSSSEESHGRVIGSRR